MARFFPYLFAFVLLFVGVAFFSNAHAQMVIGKDPQTPTARNYILLELKASGDSAQTFILPGVKTTQKNSITPTGTNPILFPLGGSVFDFNLNTVDIYTKPRDAQDRPTTGANEWKSLFFEASSDDASGFINVVQNITESTITNNAITIPSPAGFRPYTTTASGTTSGSGTSATQQPVVSVSYNSFMLTQGRDFEATLEPTTATGTTTQSVKLTFKTLVPEEKADIDKILVQYVPL